MSSAMLTETTETGALMVNDLDVDALLAIPEILETVNEYLDIQSEYRDEIFRVIKNSPEEQLPDVSHIADHYGQLLDDQKKVIRDTVAKYS